MSLTKTSIALLMGAGLAASAFTCASAHGRSVANAHTFGVSMNVSGQGAGPGLSFRGDHLSADVGFDYKLSNTGQTGAKSTNAWGIGADLGMRSAIATDTHLIYGAWFDYHSSEGTSTTSTGGNLTATGWAVGPYIGISYNLSTNLLLAAAVVPYAYNSNNTGQKDVKDSTRNDFLAHAGISLTYLMF